MAVSKRTRFEVFKRDAFTCQYCGRTPPTVILEADHVVPVAEGGPDDMVNLVTACFDCNRGKSCVPLDCVPESVAAAMEEKRVRAAQIKEYNKFLAKIRRSIDKQVDALGRLWFDPIVPAEHKGRYTFAADQKVGVRVFLEKLPLIEIIDAIEITHRRKYPTLQNQHKAFLYFCGICWNKIREREGGQ